MLVRIEVSDIPTLVGNHYCCEKVCENFKQLEEIFNSSYKYITKEVTKDEFEAVLNDELYNIKKKGLKPSFILVDGTGQSYLEKRLFRYFQAFPKVQTQYKGIPVFLTSDFLPRHFKVGVDND